MGQELLPSFPNYHEEASAGLLGGRSTIQIQIVSGEIPGLLHWTALFLCCFQVIQLSPDNKKEM